MYVGLQLTVYLCHEYWMVDGSLKEYCLTFFIITRWGIFHDLDFCGFETCSKTNVSINLQVT